jgi:hypothetical protein
VEQVAEKMEARAGDPQEVADLVTKLLIEPAPKLRYPLGPGVAARLWLRRVLPFEGFERILKRVFGF